MYRRSAEEDVLTSEAYRRAVRGLECMRCGYPPRSRFCHTDEGKGAGIKTGDRKGWAGCGPHDGTPGCHHFVGTSGTLPKAERKAKDARLAAKTRASLRARALAERAGMEGSMSLIKQVSEAITRRGSGTAQDIHRNFPGCPLTKCAGR